MTMMMERPATGRQRRGPAPRRPEGSGEVMAGDWMDLAACRHEDPELFFDGLSPVSREKARAVCLGCPVREACLRSAMREEKAPMSQTPAQNRKGRYGIRGGLTSGERWPLAYPGEKPRPDEPEAS